MKLKAAILDVMTAEQLRQCAEDYEVEVADRRKRDVLVSALRRKRSLSEANLLEYLSEVDVKAVCEAVEVGATGRRGALVERLLSTLAGSNSDREVRGSTEHEEAEEHESEEAPGDANTDQYSVRTISLLGRGRGAHQKEQPAAEPVGAPDMSSLQAEPSIERLTLGSSESQSADIAANNLEQLQNLFPEAFTEGRIDFEVLKQLLGASVDEREEKYGLNWHGKRRARQLALTPSTGTLRPRPEDSVDWDTTQNLMIEGDNLEVLKLLQKSYAGKVKMIYIDPPYNTGKDFVYPDNFQDSIRNYKEVTGQTEGGRNVTSNTETSGRFHTDWLNMMYPRLQLARQLLSHDGVLAVSIDHHEVANLKTLLAGVFGEENFINQLAWVNNLKGRQISGSGAALTHEFVLVFAKNISNVDAFSIQVDWAKSKMPSAYKGFNYEVHSDAKGEYVLKNQLYNTNSAFNEVTRRNLVFNIHFNPGTGEVRTTGVDEKTRFPGFEVIPPHRCGDGRHKFHAWRWSRPKVEQESDDLEFVVSGNGYQIFTKVRGHATTSLKDLLTDISTNEGEQDLKALFGENPFSYPKPLTLLRTLVQALSSGIENEIVMDFFAGSGTTAHAVMAQNAEDGGARRFVMVQLPEPISDEVKEQQAAATICRKLKLEPNIAALTEERLRRASANLRNDHPGRHGDIGFRVFRLDDSNLRVWKSSGDLAHDLLENVDHLVEGRSADDLLSELLLKLGLDLSVPIKKRAIAGKAVHSIGGGVLLACLDANISAADAEPLALGIADWHQELASVGNSTCVFRDSAFVDDVAKTNLAAILQQHGIANVRSL